MDIADYGSLVQRTTKGRRDKRPFWFPPITVLCGKTSHNLGTALFQVETSSLSFTPKYLHSMFEFGIDLNHTVYFIYADWKCELREGVLNIIKLGYKGTSFEVI